MKFAMASVAADPMDCGACVIKGILVCIGGRSGGRTVQDLRNYRVEEILKDGTTVTVRAVCPDDGEKIHTAFKGLERETVYTRFFGYKNDVTDAELARITSVDFELDVALLVTTGHDAAETVIGGVSYFASDADPHVRSAELAFTVEEDYQGRGIAGSLMRHIIGIARQNRLDQLEADVLARNLPMLGVFKRSGLPMSVRHDGDLVHVTLALRPPLSGTAMTE
jgi:GNAT superfamily N-acetyltransferase